MASPPPNNPQDVEFYNDGASCEAAESYCCGSFHPVHLGDVFQDRYEIIRKLGNGSFATVWLAVDRHFDRPENHSSRPTSDGHKSFQATSKYVALKVEASGREASQELDILRVLASKAENSPDAENIVGLTDSFIHEGPNGKHHCLVSIPMGPSVASSMNQPPDYVTRFPLDQARNILRSVLKGLRFLHSHGVVHGDLQSGNFLFPIKGLCDVSLESLRQQESSPRVHQLWKGSDSLDGRVPKYLVEAEPISGDLVSMISDRVGICDFGGAFLAEQAPRSIVTPVALRAPETILHESVGPAIDIWSFGCLLFEYLVGAPLFEIPPLPSGVDDIIDDDQLIQFSDILGPLPPGLLEKWQHRDQYYLEDGQRRSSATNPIDNYMNQQYGLPGADSSQAVVEPPTPLDSLEIMFREQKPSEIGDDEEAVILSLLRQILRYDPNERPSAVDLLEHVWFKE
ncbi:serine/threonine-protein kinase SRPK3 [Coniochaeta sp. PMI_546]|nr:serine/threonine-protein kinase SRPK3 [Coniochaeta sp. PMI_546]